MAKKTQKVNTTLASQWPQLANWPKGTTGKPSAATLNKVVGAGYRQGTNTAFALAMYLTAPTTQKLVATVCGGPYLNVYRHVATTGQVKAGRKARATQTKVKVDGKQHTAYKVALQGQPKAKAQAKARAPRKAKATTPAPQTNANV